MVKVLIHTQAKDLTAKVMAVTKKCMEIRQDFDHFGWEFNYHRGQMYFSAWHRNGEGEDRFEFPINMVEVDEKYEYIRHVLDELKWTALLYKEEDDG